MKYKLPHLSDLNITSNSFGPLIRHTKHQQTLLQASSCASSGSGFSAFMKVFFPVAILYIDLTRCMGRCFLELANVNFIDCFTAVIDQVHVYDTFLVHWPLASWDCAMTVGCHLYSVCFLAVGLPSSAGVSQGIIYNVLLLYYHIYVKFSVNFIHVQVSTVLSL